MPREHEKNAFARARAYLNYEATAKWLALLSAAVLAILVVAGLGWSIALVPGSLLMGVSLAPSFGIAVLVLAGLIAGRLGIPLHGAPGVGVVIAGASAGWLLALSVIRRRTSRAGPEARSERAPATAAP